MLVEVSLSSYRIKHKDLVNNDQALRENLDFLPELRLVVKFQAATYEDRINKAYDKRILKRLLMLGDLMLRRTTAIGTSHTEGKLTTNLEGPYQIAKQIGHGSFDSTTTNDIKLKNCWNANSLKKYYV